jgi:hypothetical protein
MAEGTVRHGGLFISVPKGLRERMCRLAKANDRSVQAQVRLALREHLDRRATGERPTARAKNRDTAACDDGCQPSVVVAGRPSVSCR